MVIALASCRPKPPAKPDPRIGQLEKELADTKAALDKEHQEAESLRQSDSELKKKADEAAALEAKLAEQARLGTRDHALYSRHRRV